RERRRRGIRIINWQSRAGRHLDMSRSQLIERATLSPLEKSGERREKIDALDVPPFRDATQRRRKPLVQRCAERVVGDGWPARFVLPNERKTLAKTPRRIGPGKSSEPATSHLARERGLDERRIRVRDRRLAQNDRAKALALSRDDAV